MSERVASMGRSEIVGASWDKLDLKDSKPLWPTACSVESGSDGLYMVTIPCSHLCPASVTSLTCSFLPASGFALMFKTRYCLVPHSTSSAEHAIAFGHADLLCVLLIKEVYQKKLQNEIWVQLSQWLNCKWLNRAKVAACRLHLQYQ